MKHATGILNAKFKDKEELHLAYMPFIKNGGLFIQSTAPYKMNEDVFSLISLPNEDRKIPVAGKIVWLNTSSNLGHPQGVGIQFVDSAENAEFKAQIEAILLAYKPKSPVAHTM